MQTDFVGIAMDSFLGSLASLPSPVIDGIIGGIVGALVVLLFRTKDGQRALDRWREGPLRRVPLWIPVISAVIVIWIEISQAVTPLLQASARPDAEVELIEKTVPVFKAIFQYHPEAKEEMRVALQKIYAGLPDQIRIKRRQLSATISNRYFDLHLATASNAAIHKVLKTNSAIVEALSEKPKACVGFFLETGFNAGDIPASLLGAMTDAKADVIESSIKNPTHRENLTREQAGSALVGAYRENSFDFSEVEKISNLNSLPAEDGCPIARHFSAVLANMDEKTAASVFTSLAAMAK